MASAGGNMQSGLSILNYGKLYILQLLFEKGFFYITTIHSVNLNEQKEALFMITKSQKVCKFIPKKKDLQNKYQAGE